MYQWDGKVKGRENSVSAAPLGNVWEDVVLCDQVGANGHTRVVSNDKAVGKGAEHGWGKPRCMQPYERHLLRPPVDDFLHVRIIMVVEHNGAYL